MTGDSQREPDIHMLMNSINCSVDVWGHVGVELLDW